jgi:hypothetical protein
MKTTIRPLAALLCFLALTASLHLVGPLPEAHAAYGDTGWLGVHVVDAYTGVDTWAVWVNVDGVTDPSAHYQEQTLDVDHHTAAFGQVRQGYTYKFQACETDQLYQPTANQGIAQVTIPNASVSPYVSSKSVQVFAYRWVCTVTYFFSDYVTREPTSGVRVQVVGPSNDTSTYFSDGAGRVVINMYQEMTYNVVYHNGHTDTFVPTASGRMTTSSESVDTNGW